MRTSEPLAFFSLLTANIVLAQNPNGGGGEAKLPDLSALGKMFPEGKESHSPILNITIAPGPYKVNITTDPNFPDRTIYVPLDVPADMKVPLFAWENGMCFRYGLMYYDYLNEIASHGFFIVAPGSPTTVKYFPQTNKSWQTLSIKQTFDWKNAPFKLDQDNIAIGGHSCGGMETIANTAATDRDKRIKTAVLLNTSGSQAQLKEFTIPTLWVHGGPADVAYAAEGNYQYLVKQKPTVPAFKAVLETGHLGSFYSPRGGVYAETTVHWFNWLLKGNATEKAFFAGGVDSGAAKRGWKTESNAIA